MVSAFNGSSLEARDCGSGRIQRRRKSEGMVSLTTWTDHVDKPSFSQGGMVNGARDTGSGERVGRGRKREREGQTDRQTDTGKGEREKGDREEVVK